MSSGLLESLLADALTPVTRDETVPIPDFRTVRDQTITRPSPDLLDTIYICQQRQEWYRDFARSEREPVLPFVGSLTTAISIVEAASRIAEDLHFDLDERRRMPTWTEALRLRRTGG